MKNYIIIGILLTLCLLPLYGENTININLGAVGNAQSASDNKNAARYSLAMLTIPQRKLFKKMIHKFLPQIEGQPEIGRNDLLKISNIMYTRFNRTKKRGIALVIVGCFIPVLLIPGIPMTVIGTIRKNKFMRGFKSLTKQKFNLMLLNEIKY